MIEDLDGGARGPSRRGHVLVLSVLLAVGCVIGWAAANSTAFQGPFATPAPSAPALRYTPVPAPARIDPAVGPFPFVYSNGCFTAGTTTSQVVFVGGQIVTVTRPQSATLPTCAPAPRPWSER